MTVDRIRETGKKVFFHTMEDGLMVIFLGATMLCSAGIVVNTAFMPFFAFPILFFPLIINAIKRRFTYPRTGYVKLPGEKPERYVLGMAIYVVAVFALMTLLLFVLGNVADRSAWRKWAPLMAAILVGGGIHYVASKSGRTRLYVFQGLSLTVGLAVSLMNSGVTYRGVQVYLLLVGACAVLLGLAEFTCFLRKYPVRAREEDAHAEG